MRWLKVKGHKNYLINELGMVYSKKTDIFIKPYSFTPEGSLYVGLYKEGRTYSVSLDRLVLDHFQPSQTKINVFAWHKDLEIQNNENTNLRRCNRGDRKRMFNEMRKKKRGVYAWNIGNNRYRVVLKDPNKKSVTIGYYRTEIYATLRYIQAYKRMYGHAPY